MVALKGNLTKRTRFLLGKWAQAQQVRSAACDKGFHTVTVLARASKRAPTQCMVETYPCACLLCLQNRKFISRRASRKQNRKFISRRASRKHAHRSCGGVGIAALTGPAAGLLLIKAAHDFCYEPNPTFLSSLLENFCGACSERSCRVLSSTGSLIWGGPSVQRSFCIGAMPFTTNSAEGLSLSPYITWNRCSAETL